MCVIVGCGGKTRAPARCAAGEPIDCACEDGSHGAALCLDDAGVTTCVCAETALFAAESCGEPGTLHPCACPNGATGERVCRDDGSFGSCGCDSASGSGAAGDRAAEADATMPPNPPPSGAEPERCCHGQGMCVAQALIPVAEHERFGRDSCGNVEQACVPDAFLSPDTMLLRHCQSFAGVEGRCFPECLPEIAAQRGDLPRDLCSAHERCVPCADPFTGESSGACALGADPGPDETPVVFAHCCATTHGPIGRCLPGDVVPDAAKALPALECQGTDEVCVLDVFIADPQARFATCQAGPDIEGACVPACMVESNLVPLLIRDVCAEQELCVPCSIAGQTTGVCIAP